MNSKHILVADACDASLATIKNLLNKKYGNVKISTAKDSYSALSVLKNNRVDTIILDVEMILNCEVNALAIAKQLVSDIGLVALFKADNMACIPTCHEAGVKGFIDKSKLNVLLGVAIEAVDSGAYYFEPSMLTVLMGDLGQTTIDATKTLVMNLTDTERRLMQMIAEELTNEEIADKLFLGIKTLERRIHQLFDKFQVNSKVGLAAKAGRYGITHHKKSFPKSKAA